MKCYSVHWDFGNNPIIEGNLMWCLPGVECPVCGATWGQPGCEYPAVDLSPLPNVTQYEMGGWAVPLESWRRLRQPIRKLLPVHLPLPPGAEFGPISGRALAKVGDFAWARTCTPLISEEALSKLRSQGLFKLTLVPAEIIFRGKQKKQMSALHIEPRALLSPRCLAEFSMCEACGFIKRRVVNPILVQKSSVPLDADLFRVRTWETRILASEHFFEAVQALGLKDIRFIEIALAEDE